MSAKPAKSAKSEDAKEDQIGAFPREYDTDALPERRSAALARMMTIIAVTEAFALTAMGFALAALLPLQKVVPMVITANDKSDEIIRVNPTSLESPTADYVTEIQLRNYVGKRYAIVGSNAEQTINWGPGSVVQLMSTPDAYQNFMRTAKPEWDRLRASGMSRKVRVDSVRKIGEKTWQVEFVTTDSADATPYADQAAGQSQAWVSTYEVDFKSMNVTYADRLNNPFGMIVTSASDARRD